MRAKECRRCGERKPSEAFSKRRDGDGLVSYCKGCQREYISKWYSENKAAHNAKTTENSKRYRSRNRQYVASYLAAHPCVDCGEPDPVVLEFDHVRGEKIGDISRLKRKDTSMERLLEEIAKCDVRCANCHRRVTARRRCLAAGEV